MGAEATIRRWEFRGIVWIVATGVPLHFLHSGSGWAAVAWLAPVTESIWEHFKLAFWPGLAWAAIEWTALPERRAGLWTGKLVSLALTPILIAAVFTGYTAILGTHLLAIDIATFVVAVAAGQWAGCRVWLRAKDAPMAAWLVALLALLFVVFSFRPPSNFLFQDPVRRPRSASAAGLSASATPAIIGAWTRTPSAPALPAPSATSQRVTAKTWPPCPRRP